MSKTTWTEKLTTALPHLAAVASLSQRQARRETRIRLYLEQSDAVVINAAAEGLVRAGATVRVFEGDTIHTALPGEELVWSVATSRKTRSQCVVEVSL